jgi:hypothetical protein
MKTNGAAVILAFFVAGRSLGDEPLQHQEAVLPAAIVDAESLAAALRSIVPKGWKLSVQKDSVIIGREAQVEVFNAIGLPAFKTDAERRAYVQPHVRKLNFTITLWLGEHLDKKEYDRAKRINEVAYEKARNDAAGKKLMPDEEFWRQHPEYGYRRLPSFQNDTGKSIFMTVDPYGGPWEFLSREAKSEVDGLVDRIGKQFTPY